MTESGGEQSEGAVRNERGERVDSLVEGSFLASTELQEIQAEEEDVNEPVVTPQDVIGD